MTINNVTIGDKFKHGKHTICEVVDFYETKSMTDGETKSFQCIANGIDSFATNTFEVPFSTVVRNRI